MDKGRSWQSSSHQVLQCYKEEQPEHRSNTFWCSKVAATVSNTSHCGGSASAEDSHNGLCETCICLACVAIHGHGNVSSGWVVPIHLTIALLGYPETWNRVYLLHANALAAPTLGTRTARFLPASMELLSGLM
ncbi:hypothetical protein A0H81_00074 [Grifola frondosa]|uniref:Uncharacterized protein n=1 Tax=Grifola frondosa TaxID=5627 RepID=A0A1C7MRG1_GRIFR|nr:hypothetical protein A0H81_00074 [Grifola frondosa]